MKKILFGLISTVLLTNMSFGQATVSECNEQLEIFKTQVKSNSNGQIILSDFAQPNNLTSYLKQINKSNIKINTSSHITLDTKSDSGILEIYSIQYSSDESKYLIIIENQIDLTQSNIVDASFDFSNKSIKLLAHNDFLVDTNLQGKRSWSQCFGDCMSAGLDAHGLLGQVIIVGGASAAICPPCGAVASVYVGVLLLGCSGGCVH